MRKTLVSRPGRAHLFAALCALLAVAGCEDSDDFVSPQGFITLSVSPSSVPADGRSRIDLVASIDPKAEPDRRTIVFTTTAGELVGAADSDKKMLKVVAGTDGRALAQLLSATSVGSAIVTVSVEGQADKIPPAQQTVDFTEVVPDEVIRRLSASAETTPADGLTRVQIWADVAPGISQVTFSSNLGQFSNMMDSIPAQVNSNRRATADLTSTTVGTARVSATVGQTTVEIEIEFVALEDGFITLSVSADSVPADGKSRVDLTAMIDPDSRPDRRTVVFRTTDGTLIGASGGSLEVVAGSDGRALAQLESPERAGSAVVTATVKGQTNVLPAQKTVTFTELRPDDVIELGTSDTSAPADDTTEIEVRAKVTASSGINEVRFITDRGTFSNRMTELTAPVASNREARAELTSLEVGTARITATGGDFTVETEVEFVTPDDDFVVLDAARTSAPADGKTVTEVWVDSVRPGLRVKFTTSEGKFVESEDSEHTRETNAQNRAVVHLQSADVVSNAQVSASVGVVESQMDFAFEHSCPDRVVVTLSGTTLEAKPTASATVTVKLSRDNGGVVSPGTEVAFSLVETVSSTALSPPFLFRDQTSSGVDSTLSATLIGAATEFRGLATVVATVDMPEEGCLEEVGTKTIEIVDATMSGAPVF